MKSAILILETSDVGAAYTAKAVLQLGYEPIFLCDVRNYYGDTRKQLEKYRHYRCDTKSQSAILNIIKHITDEIVAVTTFLDSRLGISISIAKELDVIGLDNAILALSNKSNVTSLIPQFCPESITFYPKNIPIETLSTFLEKHSKVILKPADAAGGIGVLIVDARDDLNIINTHIKSVIASNTVGKCWLAQAYIEGELFSFEGYIHNDVLYPLGISKRGKIKNTESHNFFPADDAVNTTIKQNILTALTILFKQTNFKNGYFHSEFIVSENKFYLIDVNAGRLGGATIGEQIALSYQKDPIDIFKHVLNISLFQNDNENPYNFRLSKKTLGISYGIDDNAILKNVHLPTARECFHTLILDENCRVNIMGKDNWSWVGLLSGFYENVESYVKDIEILTNSGLMKPIF